MTHIARQDTGGSKEVAPPKAPHPPEICADKAIGELSWRRGQTSARHKRSLRYRTPVSPSARSDRKQVPGRKRPFPHHGVKSHDFQVCCPSAPFARRLTLTLPRLKITSLQRRSDVLPWRQPLLEQITFEIDPISKLAFRGKTWFSPDARRACVPARGQAKPQGCIATYPRHFVAGGSV